MSQAIDYSKIDLSILPFNVQVLIAVIGFIPTVSLCKNKGGTRVYVPASIEHSQELKSIINDDLSFQNLIDRFKGDYLDVPKIDSIERQMKYLLVNQLREQGMSYDKIALATGFTRRWVIEITKEAANDDSQQDLFEQHTR